MFRSRYQFYLMVQDTNGGLLRREPIRDFRPCLEDLLFTAVLTGKLPNEKKLPDVEIEPLGRTERLRGFRFSLAGQVKEFGVATVLDRVWQIASEGKFATELSKDETEKPSLEVRWWVEALPKEDGRGLRNLRATVTRQPFPISERSLAEFGIKRRQESYDELQAFVSSNLIEELRKETANSLETERADLLAGYLVSEGPEVAVVVLTGRIPADTGTTASKTRVNFSPLTFHAAQQQLTRRPEDNVLGWHHNHPPPCGQMCLATVPACKTESVFFSVDDRVVHRVSFPAPYMVALVSGKGAGRRADDPIVRAFGWKDGMVQEINYSVF